MKIVAGSIVHLSDPILKFEIQIDRYPFISEIQYGFHNLVNYYGKITLIDPASLENTIS